MDNKKIGEFIKDLLKSKGMNQEDLAKVLNVSPQAVSKSLNGANTFDIANLKIISELFKVTIDDILEGELQTSTSFMTDQERLVKLGLNAFKNADEKVLKAYDKKEKTTLHYAIMHKNLKIMAYIINKGWFNDSKSMYIEETDILQQLFEGEMFSEISSMIYFKDSYKLVDKHCEDLWASTDDKLIEILYHKGGDVSYVATEKIIINLEYAIKHNNQKVIDYWKQWFETADTSWSEIPYLNPAIKYGNFTFIKDIFTILTDMKKVRRVRTNINAIEAYKGSEEILDFFISMESGTNVITQVKVSGYNDLLLEFFNSGDFNKFNKYLKYGSLDSNFLNKVDFNKIDIENLLFLFQSGSMPSVIYDNSSSVQNYVEVVNKIILKLTQELVKQTKK